MMDRASRAKRVTMSTSHCVLLSWPRMSQRSKQWGHATIGARVVLEGVAKPYFTGSSLILSPPFAMGMTQMGVATSAELSSDI